MLCVVVVVVVVVVVIVLDTMKDVCMITAPIHALSYLLNFFEKKTCKPGDVGLHKPREPTPVLTGEGLSPPTS